MLRDRDTAVDYNVDADLFVLTDLEMMGVAELIDSDVYTINTTYPEIAAIDYETLFDQRLSQAEHAYDLHKRTFTDIYEYVESVSENNLFITGMSPIALGIGNYEMVAVVKKENGTNTLWTSDEGQLEVGLSGLTGDVTLSFIGGRCYDWELADIITLKIYFYDGSSEREVASVILDNVTIDNYDISVQVKDTDTALYVRAFYSNEEPVCVEDVNKVFIINAVIA